MKNKLFINFAILGIAILFFIASLIPGLGPSLLAYTLGRNKSGYERHEFLKIHAMGAMLLGESIFSLIIAIFTYGFHGSEIWLIILIVNYCLSIIFYLLGYRKAE